MLLAVSLCACENGCSPEEGLNTLEFWKEHSPSTPADDEFVLGRVTAPFFSFAWGRGELSPLPDIALDKLYMKYQSPLDRSDVYLFARDPLEHSLVLKDTWACPDYLDGDCWEGDYYWSAVTTIPRDVPYAVLSPHNPTRLDLDQELFWAGAEPTWPASYPDGQGSVKAVRIYDHGACSYPIGLDYLLWTISHTLWDSFVAENQGTAADEARCNWLNTFAYLDHIEGDPLDVRGGFFMDLYFEVVINEPFVNDVHIYFNSNYRFKLTDGILDLASSVNHGRVDGYDAEATLWKMHTALRYTLPAEFYQTMLQRQLVDIGPDDPQDPFDDWNCWVGSAGACDFVAFGFEDAIRDGGENLPLGEDEVQSLVDAALQDSQGEYINFSCVPVDDEGHGRCHYVTRAKRLNVYPKKVELVWFDIKEVNNPAYALYVAIHANPSPGELVSELCLPRPSYADLLYVRVPFAHYEAPFDLQPL